MLKLNTDCTLCSGIGAIPVNDDQWKICDCVRQKLMQEMLEFAKIPREFKALTVTSFSTRIYNNETNNQIAKIAKKIVNNYITNFEVMQEKGKGLFFYSQTRGSGKTRLAVSLGNALIAHKNQRVRFITTLELLGKIKSTFSNKSDDEETMIQEFCDIPILILDDLGTEKQTNFVNELFFRILDARMVKKKITLITSNVEIEALPYDERIKSRIARMTFRVAMPEFDTRIKLAEQENKELLNLLYN